MKVKRILLFFIVGIIFGLTLTAGRELVGRGEIYLYLDINENYLPGQEIQYSISGQGVEKIYFKLIKVDLEEMMLQSSKDGNSSDLSGLELKNAKVIKEWTEDTLYNVQNDDWFNMNKKLDNPGPGAYILQASAAKSEVSLRLFTVSSMAAIMKSDDNRAIVFATDKKTGEPIAGASIKFIQKGKVKHEGVSGKDGTAWFENVGDADSSPVLLESDGNYAVMNFYNYGGGGSDYVYYFYTDRPAYRPNQKVLFKGMLRDRDNNGVYTIPDVEEVTVTISDARGNQVYEESLKLSEFGSFSGKMKLGDEPPLGHYSIYCSAGHRDYYSDFQVEEYRKPEYEITVEPNRGTVVSGDEIEFLVTAKYYFGEPVKDAVVQYQVNKRSYWWSPWSRRYSWYYEDNDYYNPRGGHGENVASGEGRTNDSGQFVIKVKDTKVDSDMVFSVTANVTEKGRRQVSGSGTAKVMQAEYNVSVKTDRYIAVPGEKSWISVNTTDINGDGVSRALTLEISLYNWESGERKSKVVLNRTLETDSKGAVRTPFTADEPGYYAIAVKGQDSRGNATTGNANLYVMKEGQSYYWYSSGGLEIMLDRDSYEVGDTVKALIASPFEGAHALVAVEGSSLMDARAIPLKGGSAMYAFKVEEKHQPNVYFSVSLVHGNSLREHSKIVIVPPIDKFMTLTVESNKMEYEPGEEASVKVKVTDNEGRPVNAEVSLGAVDESIYALYPENAGDIRQTFYGTRYNGVNTQSSYWFYSYGDGEVKMASPMAEGAVMKDMAAQEAPGMARKMGGSRELVQPEIRSKFPDTAYWRAHIVTGDDGMADLMFKVPDTLTTWRLTSRGATKETLVGQTIHKVVATKNLLVRLQTPRFFTQDDEQNITAVVHNYLETEKEVTVILNVKGLRLEEKNEKVIRVPAGGDERVEWLAVVESPQDAWVTVKALTNEESDAMQLTIPVLPHGSKGRDATAGEVSGDNEKFTLVLPDAYLEDTQHLKLTLSPSLTAGMFDVLEYLAGYPYGCVEQTMSRFLPDVVIAETMQQAGRPLEGKLVELPEMVADGVERLRNMQHSDGGWGWWTNDDTHPYMTAYVVIGLSQAIRADFSIPDGMVSGGVNALVSMLDGNSGSGNEDLNGDDIYNTRAYMVYALSEADSLDKAYALDVYENRKKLSVYAKAVLAMTLNRVGEKDRALTLITEIEKAAEVTKTSARWEGRSFKYGWMDNVVETTSYVVMAMIEVTPENKLIAKGIRYLNLSRRGDRWYSTKDTAAAILALTRYMSEYEDPNPDYEVAVTINGNEVKREQVTKEDVTGQGIQIDLTDLKVGDNTIEIAKDGTGSLYYYASLAYFERKDRLEAQDAGIKVERWYSYDEAGEKKLKDGAKIKSGDVIWSHVKVTPGSSYDYVMIEDYLPSGFEIADQRNNDYYYYHYYFTNREERDEKVVVFYTYFWNDSYSFSTQLRAEVPGKVSAMPCRAELMYFPEMGGRSGEMSFEVVE